MSNHQGLKSRNLITFPLDIAEVAVINVKTNESGDYIVTVESTQNGAACQSCGGWITQPNGYGREIELRHLPILGHRLYLRLRPKRYKCPRCNGKTTMIYGSDYFRDVCSPSSRWFRKRCSSDECDITQCGKLMRSKLNLLCQNKNSCTGLHRFSLERSFAPCI